MSLDASRSDYESNKDTPTRLQTHLTAFKVPGTPKHRALTEFLPNGGTPLLPAAAGVATHRPGTFPPGPGSGGSGGGSRSGSGSNSCMAAGETEEGALISIPPLSLGAPAKAPRPLVLGVGGGTASGKSTFAERVQQAFGDTFCIVVPCDSFYKTLTAEQREKALNQNYDFDSPGAIAIDELVDAVHQLRQGCNVRVPVYDFAKHARTDSRILTPRPVIVVEGILVLTSPELRKLFDVKVFIECDADLRLARRVSRDILERGRNVKSVVDQYLRFVKPAFDKHIEPTKKFADVIIPNTMEQINEIGVLVIVRHIRALLRQSGAECPQTPALGAQPSPGSAVGVVGGKDSKDKPSGIPEMELS